MRDGRWKLVRVQAKSVERARFELYDLGVDPLEAMDVARANPEVLARLVKVFESRTPSEVTEWNYAPIASIDAR